MTKFGTLCRPGNLIAGLALLTVAGPTMAQAHLVRDAKITMVSSAMSDPGVFFIKTTDGTGPCNGSNTLIKFRSPADPNADKAAADGHRRTYATALLAFTTGQPVLVYDYEGSDCENADKITLYTAN